MLETIFDFSITRIRKRKISFISAGLTIEHIDDVPVKPGYIHIINRIAVENESSGYTQLRIGVYDGASFHLSEEQKTPAAATLYWSANPIYLSEGENLRIALNGCTPGDAIMVYIDEFFRKV